LVEKLIGLKLTGAQVNDDTIARLASERHMFDGLQWLDLSDSKITDRSTSLLSSLQSLRRLDLRGTALSDGVGSLIEELPKLTWIGLPSHGLGLLGKWQSRFKHPGLHFAKDGERCRP
jgi:Leucine-rich repeat (LRR) protein